MKFDYFFPNLPPTAAPDLARRAVRIGYDGFFTAETGHEPFLSMCLASQAEPGLEVGTAITLAFPGRPWSWPNWPGTCRSWRAAGSSSAWAPR